LFRKLSYAAGSVAKDEAALATLDEQGLADYANRRATFDGWMTIARAMGAAAPRNGADPAAAIEAQFAELARRAAEVEKPNPAWVLLLSEWEAGQ
jgi:hypothetical protein